MPKILITDANNALREAREKLKKSLNRSKVSAKKPEPENAMKMVPRTRMPRVVLKHAHG